MLTFTKTVHRELQGVSMEAVIAEILFWDMGVILILDLSPSEKLSKFHVTYNWSNSLIFGAVAGSGSTEKPLMRCLPSI